MASKKLGKVGVIGRWKPFHNGGATMLETLCEQAEHVFIGIGSCNKYNVRNPFTAEESKEMIDACLSKRFSNYSFVFVPDFAHVSEFRDGQKWKEFVLSNYGKLDYFVSGNDYVTNLLKDDYKVMHPVKLIPEEKRVCVNGTQVRVEMAKGNAWKSLVPEEVVDYLEKNSLVERFRTEFGLETLARLGHYGGPKNETEEEEREHTFEV
ncbi:MAG: hypothetical protein ABIB71_01550 [Candidatus Woesearchaeota archaeon]